MAASGVGTAADQKSPTAIVRELLRVQDTFAEGDRNALAGQRTMIANVSKQLEDCDPSVWSDTANIRALLNFTLSGGGGQTLRRLMARKLLEEANQDLLTGILLFAENKRDEARERLSSITIETLDASLVPPFALAKSALLLPDDKAGAMDLLDLARLDAPGMIAEEAALRRQILLALSGATTERARYLFGLYFRRFGNSLFAARIPDGFARQFVAQSGVTGAEQITELHSSLQQVMPLDQLASMVAIARESLLVGKLAVAVAAADAALDIEGDRNGLKLKARLYAAAAIAPSDKAAAAAAVLSTITDEGLSGDDVEIRDAAVVVARRVMANGVHVAMPDQFDSADAAPADAVAADAAAFKETGETAALIRANQLAQSVDQLMKDAP